MKRTFLYLLPLAIALSATACNNSKPTEENKDTVVVEKNTTTTVESSHTDHTESTEPSTSVSVDGNGVAVGTKSTNVKVSKDSVTYNKH